MPRLVGIIVVDWLCAEYGDDINEIDRTVSSGLEFEQMRSLDAEPDVASRNHASIVGQKLQQIAFVERKLVVVANSFVGAILISSQFSIFDVLDLSAIRIE